MNKISFLILIVLFVNASFANTSRLTKRSCVSHSSGLSNPVVKKDSITQEEAEKLRNALTVLSIFVPSQNYFNLSTPASVVSESKETKTVSKEAFISFANSGLKKSSQATYSLSKDTIKTDEVEMEMIQSTLDSLMNMWEVKQTLKGDTADHILNAPYVPDSVYITRLAKINSLIQLPYNQNVRKWIELYTRRNHKRMSIMLGLSDYFFPLFEEVLEANGLPQELKYLPIIESALNPRAVSRVGATGLWQFMYGTGKLYGLTVNSFVDDRRDPLKATMAAVKYLKEMYGMYKDWAIVLAAYNAGSGTINRAIRRSGGKKTYWEIYNFLPKETRGYVPAFIAATYSFNYYKEHNITKLNIDLPVSTDTIIVTRRLHLQQVAEYLHVPIEKLRDMNPQYKYDIIPAVNERYTLRLPGNLADKFAENEKEIYRYKDSIFFSPVRIAEIKQKGKMVRKKGKKGKYQYVVEDVDLYATGSNPAASNQGKVVYTVKKGDNISSIANLFNVQSNDIRIWNAFSKKHKFAVGRKLSIFVPSAEVNKYAELDKMSAVQKQNWLKDRSQPQATVVSSSVPAVNLSNVGNDNSTVSSQSVVKNNSSVDAKLDQSESLVTYVVKKGDKMVMIASCFNLKATDLRKWNVITKKKGLKVGRILNIYVPTADIKKFENVDAMSLAQKMTWIKQLKAKEQAQNTVKSQVQPEAYLAQNTNDTDISGDDFILYTVKKGDSISSIAKKFPGATNDKIMKWNDLTNSVIKNLKPGNVIKIKKQ